MRIRKRNNMIIGILCCALVFMGLGYAVLSTVLNIGGTANINSDFNIHFLNDDQNKKGMTLVDYTASQQAGSTVYNTSATEQAAWMESNTGVNSQDPTIATFSALLRSPNDYATFTATVKNYGTIAGAVSNVTIEEEPNQTLIDWLEGRGLTEDDWDQFFSISHTIQTGATLSPGDTEEFTITVTYVNSAEAIPQGAIDFTINITYQQLGGSNNGGNNQQVVYVDQDDSCFISFIDGEINYYDTSKQGCGSTVELPSNLRLKTSTLTGYTFNNQLCLYFAPNIKGAMGYREATDQEFCTGLQGIIADLYDDGQTDLYDTYYGAFITPTYTTPTDANGTYNLITKVGAGSFAVKNISSLTLSNNITQIKASSFAGNALTTLTIPNSVTSIGEYAFAMNSSLATVNLGTGVTTIGDFSFNGDAITSLIIPSNVTSIGRLAFWGNGMTTLNLTNATGLTTIGDYAFKDNAITGTLVIPSNVVSIGEGAFGAFNGDQNKNQIQTLNLSGATSLTTIGNDAFYSNSITSVTIPSNVTTIGEYAFAGNAISTLNLSGATSLTTIGAYAFSSSGLTSLDLSGTTSLTTIGEGAFYNNSITSLTIPSSVTTIGNSAFADNSITSLTIPSSVTTIGISAFTDNGMTSLNLNNASSLETIGQSAFYNNAITSLDFSNTTSLTTIGDSAFRFNALSSLDLSGATALTTIESSAFYQNRIQTLTLPASITSISRFAFSYQNYDASNPDTPLTQMQLMTINVPMSKATFESRVSGNGWYSDGGGRNGFRIIYTDYTCNYEGTTCTAN